MNNFVFVLLLAMSAVVCSGSIFTGGICGGVSPVSRWTRTERNDTIRMNVDTNSCRFQNTPLYFASITGGVGHYLLTGIDAIYEPTLYGFTINVRSIDGANADVLMARSAQWSVQWMGLRP